ncbi:hypothetical protein CY35_02G148400 [Sphagnum magellanicum]|nr:hypothetical protein CY35_02G148400 [Sphagnum magellanicum]KAH9572416.1 hypothetical protein CY35_02G148400 [Sphagnum magellanicum]
MMAAAAKEVPDSSSNHSKDDSSSGGDGSSSLSNHTVILGWNTKLASLVRQLAMANHSLGGGVIAVFADKDTQQMEEEMKAHELDLMGTSVIYHTGCPLDKTALQKVAVSEARATIILAETTDAEESDTRAVKIVRAICWTVEHDEMKGHIVVEVVDPENEAWVKQAGQDLVYTVAAHNLIGHLLVQCARQPGLAQVWEDILGFDNAEFYVKKWPELDGLPFGDVLFCFPDAIPCGVKVAAMENTIVLNPDDDYILSEGDELIVLAEDDDSYFPSKSLPKIADVQLQKSKSTSNDAKKILFCGWQHGFDDIISTLENSCVPGSEVWIFSKTAEAEREMRLADKGIKPTEFENVKLVHCIGDPSNRTDLESLPLESFDSILLSPDGDNTALHTDSHPVSTLLRIRSIQSKRMSFEDVKAVQIRQGASAQSTWVQEMQQGSNQSIIISEFLNDETTKEQIAQAGVPGVMVSDDMVAMVLAMVAEDKKVSYILSELFAQEGHEFFFRSAEIYLRGETEELSFYNIMSRARHRKEIVLGYQHAFEDHPIMNPPDKAATKTWHAHDGFIVLAEV